MRAKPFPDKETPNMDRRGPEPTHSPARGGVAMRRPWRRHAVWGLVLLLNLLVPNPICRPRAVFAQTPPSPSPQLFANACHGNDVLNQVYRIDIGGPSCPATLDA